METAQHILMCLYQSWVCSKPLQGELCQGSYIMREDEFLLDDLKKKHFFLKSTVSNPLSGKWEVFIHDGRHVMYIAQVLELKTFPKDAITYIHGICKKAKDIAFMNTFYDMFYDCKSNKHALTKLYDEVSPQLLRIVMSHDAKLYERRTYDSVIFWKRKFFDVYGVLPIFDETASVVEWEWDDVWCDV